MQRTRQSDYKALTLSLSHRSFVFLLLQVVFPTFAPPELPSHLGGVGHWFRYFLT